MELKYSLFHREDLEKVLKAVDARPAFRRMRFVELLASGGSTVCSYGSFVVVIGDVGIESMREFRVKITKLDDGRPFRLGSYATEDDEILIDADFDEFLFHDAIPALLCELARGEIMLRECEFRVRRLSEGDGRLTSEIVRLSRFATDVRELESLAFEISQLRSGFFSSVVQLRNVFGEAYGSLLMAKAISSHLGGLLAERIDELQARLSEVEYAISGFNQTLNAVRDALDVVHLQLEMLQRKENVELQRRTSALLAAAAVIEFVAVFYYTMGIWKTFAPVDARPAAFGLLAAFSTLVVACTEAIGEAIVNRRIGLRLIILAAASLLTLAAMAALPTLAT